ncbi:hypothetical protein P153DRAFT_287636 [Dothidotthia symphoricarpi CBS 119687]|uniref:Pathogen-related protein n=1 Tax=Dothidotthia symphoricarpi CBS 119687 TaxID=1392245 RepID=A0A6A6AHB4_9PLEO|nr:uncharacterized protein P153DRAFT_287636 [Dothidotthia symphoricarpi CBS 119687]KAF2131200.1 hypothetical protein P153DRAFT_287636 [Dothidotthia symphoricarpi CBS 119687]
MSTENAQQPPAPELPDYVTDPNAVLKDEGVKWRYGRAPDYTKTRKVFEETKEKTHAPLSLPQLVENLVKNWEIEASFKPHLPDWRTIDPQAYSFAINASEPEPASHMLKLGTYNAIIAANEYYSPEHSDFASSHKTFKRMMPAFAWEVLEVYSGPPVVAFRWRHWGVMAGDYVGINNKGEKVRAKAHGGTIDIQGVTVASVNEKLQLRDVRTWFDPMDMFRQIAPEGDVEREVLGKGVRPADVVEGAQAEAGVQAVPDEQTLPDETIDASALARAQAAGCPFAVAVSDAEVGLDQLPAGHPSVEEPVRGDENLAMPGAFH